MVALRISHSEYTDDLTVVAASALGNLAAGSVCFNGVKRPVGVICNYAYVTPIVPEIVTPPINNNISALWCEIRARCLNYMVKS